MSGPSVEWGAVGCGSHGGAELALGCKPWIETLNKSDR